jgi:hypothetical protein
MLFGFMQVQQLIWRLLTKRLDPGLAQLLLGLQLTRPLCRLSTVFLPEFSLRLRLSAE